MTSPPPAMRSEDDLVIRARTCREALARLYGEYYPRILRYCCARLSDRSAAEDATSETFLQIARHIPTFSGTTDVDFRRWAFHIAANGPRTNEH